MNTKSSLNYIFEEEHSSPYLDILITENEDLEALEKWKPQMLKTQKKRKRKNRIFPEKPNWYVPLKRIQQENYKTGILQFQTSPQLSGLKADAKELYDKAVSFFNEDDKSRYLLAIIGFQRLLYHIGFPKSKENLATTYFNLGITNLELKRRQAAVFYFELCLDQNPNHLNAPKIYRETKANLGRLPQKAGNSKRSQNRVFSEVKRLFKKAERYYYRNRYTRSIYYLERARQGSILNNYSDERKNAILYAIALSNYFLGRYSATVSYLEHYIEKKGKVKREQEFLSEAKFALGLK